MCKIPKGNKEISSKEITIKLHHKRPNQTRAKEE
jgi:hypothetical protein